MSAIKAFDLVIQEYSDQKSTDGSIQAKDYGKQMGGGKNTLKVRPSISDFLCDVELVVRRMLPQPRLQTLFRNLYVNCSMTEQQASDNDLLTIKFRVGKELIRRQIHPTHLYFKGKDIIRARS
jgi:hypothetical protein